MNVGLFFHVLLFLSIPVVFSLFFISSHLSLISSHQFLKDSALLLHFVWYFFIWNERDKGLDPGPPPFSLFTADVCDDDDTLPSMTSFPRDDLYHLTGGWFPFPRVFLLCILSLTSKTRSG